MRDAIGRRRGRPPVVLPVFGGPGSGAILQREVDAFYRAIDEVDGAEWMSPRQYARHPDLGEWRNEALALELLSLIIFRPARHADRVRCPVLAHIGERDRIVPVKPTLRTLRKIRNVNVQQLPGGHFDPFYGASFERSVEAQIAFFRAQLVDASRGATSQAATRI